VSQGVLFPPTFQELVPAGHLVHFVRRLVVEDLDLSAIYAKHTERKGQPPYDPRLMTALLLYCYSRGIYTSRRIEQSCEERLDVRALVGNEHPDHSTIAKFRKDHRDALSGLFVQVLALCREAGMVKLGHVSLDGTKVKANASRHSAMSYKRLLEAEPELARVVREWLESAREGDEADDLEFGDLRGDEVPEHVQAAARKLAKVRAARERLEAEAQAEAERVAAERAAKEKERGGKLAGRPPKALDGVPDDKAQSNFTDPESRIMKTKDGYDQAYTAHAAVDAEDQVIVSQDVTARQNDGPELESMVDQIETNVGERPDQLSADAGSCSEANLAALEDRGIDGYVAAGATERGDRAAEARHAERDGRRREEAGAAHHGDAREAARRGLGESLPIAEADRGTGLRSDQRGPRFSAVSAPRTRERQG
jgi:transposase